MFKERMLQAFNEQINAELYSAYLYLSMASYLENINFAGMGSWMKVQAQEELTHAMKLYAFVNDRSGRAVMDAIEAPPSQWDSPLAVFEEVLAHEQKVTDLINNLVKIAREESDFAADNYLQWFVAEQVEEEASADEIVSKLKLVGGQGQGLFMVDQELAQRVFVMPVTTGA